MQLYPYRWYTGSGHAHAHIPTRAHIYARIEPRRPSSARAPAKITSLTVNWQAQITRPQINEETPICYGNQSDLRRLRPAASLEVRLGWRRRLRPTAGRLVSAASYPPRLSPGTDRLVSSRLVRSSSHRPSSAMSGRRLMKPLLRRTARTFFLAIFDREMTSETWIKRRIGASYVFRLWGGLNFLILRKW